MREESIREKLSSLNAELIEIENESGMHSGPRTDSHFKVLIISEAFEGLNRVARQRKVNGLLQSEFDDGMHALTMRCLTPKEATEQEIDFQSPDCASSTPRADS